MSAPAATAPSRNSTNATTQSRIEIPVTGTYWPGVVFKIKQSEDGENQENYSLEGSPVTGTAVYNLDGELHPDSVFTTAEGTSFRPFAKSNHYAFYEPFENSLVMVHPDITDFQTVEPRAGGSIYFAEGDEKKYMYPPLIDFEPPKVLSEEQASLFTKETNAGYGKVQGRDDEGHFVGETVHGTVVGKEGA